MMTAGTAESTITVPGGASSTAACAVAMYDRAVAVVALLTDCSRSSDHTEPAATTQISAVPAATSGRRSAPGPNRPSPDR